MGVFFNSKRGVLQPQEIWAKHPDDGWKPIKKAWMRVEAGSGKWRQFWPAVKKGLLDGSSLRWLLTGENTDRNGHPRDEAARRDVTSIVESSASNQFILLSEKSNTDTSIILVPEDDSLNNWPSGDVTTEWKMTGSNKYWAGKEMRPEGIELGALFEISPRNFAWVSDDGVRFIQESDGEALPDGVYEDPATGLRAIEPPTVKAGDEVEAVFPKNSIGGQVVVSGSSYDASGKYGYINATGENAKFGKIKAADMWQNYLFVLDARAQALRRVDLQTRAVVTLAGDITNQGRIGEAWTAPETVDGIGTNARFSLHTASDSTVDRPDIAVHPSGGWALVSQDVGSNADSCLRKVYLEAAGGYQENEVITFLEYKTYKAPAETGTPLTEFGWDGSRYQNLEFSPDGSALYFSYNRTELHVIDGIDTDEPRVYRLSGSSGQTPQEDQPAGNTTFGVLQHLQLRSPSGRVFAVDDGTRNEVRILGTAESS
jgi:hypothetical protein